MEVQKKKGVLVRGPEVDVVWDRGWDHHLQFLGRARRAAAEIGCKGVCAGSGLFQVGHA